MKNNPTPIMHSKLLTLIGHWQNGILSDLELGALIGAALTAKWQEECKAEAIKQEGGEG